MGGTSSCTCGNGFASVTSSFQTARNPLVLVSSEAKNTSTPFEPQTSGGGVPIVPLANQFYDLDQAIGAVATAVAAIPTAPVQAAPVDPAALKAVLLDPEVLSAIAKAVADEDHARSAS